VIATERRRQYELISSREKDGRLKHRSTLNGVIAKKLNRAITSDKKKSGFEKILHGTTGTSLNSTNGLFIHQMQRN
jgi:hypothetical protein